MMRLPHLPTASSAQVRGVLNTRDGSLQTLRLGMVMVPVQAGPRVFSTCICGRYVGKTSMPKTE